MLPNNLVVYDIETYEYAPDIKDFDVNNHRLAVGVTFDNKSGYKNWYENEPIELAEFLLGFDHIIGFNIKDFDNVVLSHNNDNLLKKLNNNSIDLLEAIEKRLGHRISLKSIVEPTLKKSKSANGKQAIDWWKSGEKDKIIEYCKMDVLLTLELYKYGLEHEEIFYETQGQIRKLKIDWNNPERKFLSTDFMYTLLDEESGKSIEIDRDNKKFFQAIELVKNTNRLLYLTGKAGTGKTTFLKYLKKNIQKNIAIVAPTGVAAINAGGQTIHSFFKINPNEPPYHPDDKRLRKRVPIDDPDKSTIYVHFQYTSSRLEVMKSLELLIIDEISMVRADLLDVIDILLRTFSGKNGSLPFGGVQVILIGDTFQLPPIEGNDWDLVRRYYTSPFFFSSRVFKTHLPIYVELDKIYRQNEIDFINLLNRIRINEPLPNDLHLLNAKIIGLQNSHFEEGFVVLCSRNEPARRINNERLNSLQGEMFQFEGLVNGQFPENAMRTEKHLNLKVGAQIMFLKNDIHYFNGKIGKIESIEDNEIYASIINNKGDKETFLLEKYTWENVEYVFDQELKRIVAKIIGTFTQYPIRLAWAITVHKSQGLTFEKVFINIDWATYGLVYVALSRCTSIGNLFLLQPIKRDSIKTDSRVVSFATNQTPDTLIIKAIDEGKADLLYKNALGLLKSGNFEESFKTFFQAVKHRNEIESEKFKRFVISFLNREKYYRELAKRTINENNGLKTEVEKFKSISEQSASDIECLKSQIDNLEKKNTELNQESVNNNTKIDKLLKDNNHLRTIINTNVNEINRLKHLSWWQKLIGTK